MPKMNITEVAEIDAPTDTVYSYLIDFKQWKEWSPWLICEPESKLDYEENAYSWDGKVTGSGKMTLTNTTENESMDYDLQFFKPWKSEADVQFHLSATETGTKVTWSMQSSLPWFLFWMKPMMVRMISMDYQRGLKMLKEKLETGSVDSQLEYDESIAVDGCHYIGIERTCSMGDMEKCMGDDFTRLMGLPLKNVLTQEEGGEHAVPFTIYHKWKLGKGLVSYTCAIPIKDKLSNIAELPYETVSGYRQPCQAFAVTHTGDYKHLGNAWSAGMMRAQNKIFAQDKKIMPFELYITEPGTGVELVTKVCLPRK